MPKKKTKVSKPMRPEAIEAMKEHQETLANKPTTSTRAPARPSEYSTELAAKLCEALALGKSVKKTCEEDKSLPNRDTVFIWLAKYPEFREMYDAAKEQAVEAMVDDMANIADETGNDFITDGYDKGKTPGFHANGEAIQRSRLRIETRRWYVSKIRPKKYGEHLDLEHSGTVNHKYQELSDEDLDRIVQERKNRTLGTS